MKRVLIPASLTFLLVPVWFTVARAQMASARNELLQPPPRNGKPIAVSVALHVLNLADIDEVSERFNLMFYLIARWRDPRLGFVPRDRTEHFRVLQPAEVWHPGLEFINGVNMRSTGDATILVNPDGQALYMERASTLLSTRFHLLRFPFDRQALEVIIHPFVGQVRQVALSADGEHSWINKEENVYSSLAEWNLFGIKTHNSGITMSRLGPISEARFEILVKRKYHYYIWKIFLPLLLIVALSWTVYFIDITDLNSQVQISITTILTVIAFNFSISLSLPKVPYLTFIDAFFLDCLVFVFFAAIEMTIVHVSARTRRSHLGLRIRRISQFWVPIAFVVSNVLLALHYFG